ncbi:hypothetical protein [Hasllibacter sp. MH4015]|uniref:hypothetical protein n=1 Tax=Hasllibacter sp. MH4015 TaxID=2854029 RepID=UPI001CD8148F|nr:hypothetical protein [Hasllibacter sp. MH4015]
MSKTIENDDLQADRAEVLVTEARDAFDRAVRVLNDSCSQLETMPDAGEGDVMKCVRQMNAAFIHTMEMREKARVAGCKRFGETGAGQLDLAAARTEIGLRLACLRGHEDGSGVPGEPE